MRYRFSALGFRKTFEALLRGLCEGAPVSKADQTGIWDVGFRDKGLGDLGFRVF